MTGMTLPKKLPDLPQRHRGHGGYKVSLKESMTLLKRVKNQQRIKLIKQMKMKQNQLNPLNPLTISGFFKRQHLHAP